MLPWVSEHSGREQRSWEVSEQDDSLCPWIDFIYFKNAVNTDENVGLSVSKTENALKTEMRDIKMKIKKNEQCNAVLEKIGNQQK